MIPERTDPGDEWPMAGRIAARTAASPAFLLGQPVSGWAYSPRRRAFTLPSAPVIRYERVYVGLGDGAWYCIDKNTGRAKWRLPVPGMVAGQVAPLTAPAVFDGLVYLGAPAGELLAVDANRGHRIWKLPVGGAVDTAPAVDSGIIYLGTDAGQLYAVENKTGALVWKRQLDGPLAAPVAAGDRQVFAVDASSRLWALDSQSGKVQWSCTSRPAAPVFAELIVVVGGTAYDPQNGQVLWEVFDQLPSPACSGDLVFYPDGAVDLFTGEYRWKQLPAPAAQDQGPPAAEPRTSAADPRTPAREPPGQDLSAPVGGVVAVGPLLLAALAGGKLLARHAEDGRGVWEVDLGAVPAHPPAVAPGMVAVAMADGSIRTVRIKEVGGISRPI